MTAANRRSIDRRSVLQGGVGAVVGACANRRTSQTANEHNNYLRGALQAAKWIRNSAIQTQQGMAWPRVPAEETKVVIDLYHGTAGIILFMSELYHATGDATWLAEARNGGEHLLRSLPEQPGECCLGLYGGAAGHVFVLESLARVTGETRFRAGAVRCLEHLKRSAKLDGDSVEWNAMRDIMYGIAGIGLVLLYSAREMGDRSSLALARKAGKRLLDLQIRAGPGVKWDAAPPAHKVYPNFSHGTSGVAYFLASLYLSTREEVFLNAAIAGARYLQSIAMTDGDVCLIMRHTPGAEQLYYLGWCHGPAGTGRLFYRLWECTGDASWLAWLHKGARGILRSGIPEKQVPGLWNNVSQCCGSAGISDFFLDLHAITPQFRYLDFAKRVGDNIVARGDSDRGGTMWIQAEHRINPEMVQAQTGYMQGAAGIGMALLRLAAVTRRAAWSFSLPDSPFRRPSA